MKRVIPTAGLVVLPKSGHTINLEEPDLFNRSVLDFVTTVDAGTMDAPQPRVAQLFGDSSSRFPFIEHPQT